MEKFNNYDELMSVFSNLNKKDINGWYENEIIKAIGDDIGSFVFSNNGIFPWNVASDVFLSMMNRAISFFKYEVIKDDLFVDTMNKLSDTVVRNKNGILLMGPVGCGKTTIIKIHNSTEGLFIERSNHMSRGFKKLSPNIIPSYKIVELFSKNGYDAYTAFGTELKGWTMMSNNLTIDDMGAEDVHNHFGNITNTVGELILRRYDSGLRTSATTN